MLIWPFIEGLEKLAPVVSKKRSSPRGDQSHALITTISTVRALPHVATDKGRVRAWLNVSLNLKVLGEALQLLLTDAR